MADKVKMILCPTCRTAQPDAGYYAHVQACQKAAAAREAAKRG